MCNLYPYTAYHSDPVERAGFLFPIRLHSPLGMKLSFPFACISAVEKEHPITENKLTVKQERFCVEYVANGGNATEAARQAGYDTTEGTYRYIGWENLTKPNIVKRIHEIRKELNLSGIVTAEWVLSKLKDVAERSLQAQAVLNDDGEPIGEFKYDSSGANRSLELLGKSLGVFVDRTELTGKDGERLQTVIYLPDNGREKD